MLQDLTRWGLPLMTERASRRRRPRPLASLGARAMLVDLRPDASAVTMQLLTGDQAILIEAGDGIVHTRLGLRRRRGRDLSGAARPILGLLLGLLELPDAQASGVELQGDPTALDRIGADVLAA